MNNILPFKENNSIAVVAFAFELSAAIPESVLLEIMNNSDSFEFRKNYVPRMQKIEATTLQIVHNPSTNAPITQSQKVSLDGVIFDSSSDSENMEPAWVFEIRSQLLLIKCHDYLSWTNAFDVVTAIINEINKFTGEAQIKSAILEYFDIFKILDNTDQKWKGELFSPHNKLLPKVVFEHPEQWHSHNGYFSKKTINGKERMVLTNYMVNFTTTQGEDSTVQIKTSHRTELEHENISIHNLVDSDLLKFIFCCFHDENKRIFQDLLTNEAKASIKLES